ncbi:MAG: thiamine diphosphokinase [Clostridiales bacterium]|nr:thiamine diphosphokinase [Clostridiales bacterium]
MKKCYVVTSYIEGGLVRLIPPGESGFVICADGGYEAALSQNIQPDLVMGDGDSGSMAAAPGSCAEFLCFPQEKDESDTFLCVKHAASLGFREVVIVGGLGGRLDHTVANLQTLGHFAGTFDSISVVDGKNVVTIVENAGLAIPKKEGFSISLFSLSDRCCGVSTKGLRYPLNDAELKSSYPLGLSNKFTGTEAYVEVKNGTLLVVMSRD